MLLFQVYSWQITMSCRMLDSHFLSIMLNWTPKFFWRTSPADSQEKGLYQTLLLINHLSVELALYQDFAAWCFVFQFANGNPTFFFLDLNELDQKLFAVKYISYLYIHRPTMPYMCILLQYRPNCNVSSVNFCATCLCPY